MEDGEGVSYEMLQDLLRQERRSNKLMPIPSGFWTDLHDFLRGAEDEFRTEQAKDPWNRKAMMLSDRVKNARHAAETVWTLRERKLAMLALAHVRDGGHPDGLTKKERGVYDQLLEVLQSGRQTVFAGTAAAPGSPAKGARDASARTTPPTPVTSATAATSAPDDATTPAKPAPREDATTPEEVPVEAAGPDASDEPGASPDPAGDQDEPTPTPQEVPPDTPDADIVTIRALGDIPPFVGPDMDTYHLKEGDLASVAQNIADLLVKRGKAAVVQAT